ncbi:hypothetical protein V2G26_015344 [Clonostachys chloroleuca]
MASVVNLDQARPPAMTRFLASFMLLFGQAEACDVGFFSSLGWLEAAPLGNTSTAQVIPQGKPRGRFAYHMSNRLESLGPLARSSACAWPCTFAVPGASQSSQTMQDDLGTANVDWSMRVPPI